MCAKVMQSRDRSAKPATTMHTTTSRRAILARAHLPCHRLQVVASIKH